MRMTDPEVATRPSALAASTAWMAAQAGAKAEPSSEKRTVVSSSPDWRRGLSSSARKPAQVFTMSSTSASTET